MRLIVQSTTTQEVAGSNPAIHTNAHTGKYIKEANAMKERHPLAGQTVKLKENIGKFMQGEAGGAEFCVEDWADNVLGRSVWATNGNPAALEYAIRTATNGNRIPIDDNAVYGKVGIFGHIVHDSEIVRE